MRENEWFDMPRTVVKLKVKRGGENENENRNMHVMREGSIVKMLLNHSNTPVYCSSLRNLVIFLSFLHNKNRPSYNPSHVAVFFFFVSRMPQQPAKKKNSTF